MKQKKPGRQAESSRIYRVLTMASLIFAGETVFLPAFHLGRYFKSSLLATFGIDEFQLGQLGAIYGVFATACYFLGGPLADRFSPRKLLALSLIATALGSAYMATFPGFGGMCVLFAYWGVTTIFAFWAPLIRATREWAHEDQQGRAFGVLDAGRGLASALIASLAALAFAWIVGDERNLDPVLEKVAVRRLILSYGFYCLAAAVCVWFFVPDSKDLAVTTTGNADWKRKAKGIWIRLVIVLRSPAIWLQALVIIAAYSAFKMLDNYGLYAEDAYGLTRANSAKLIANVSYLRFAAALAAGWIADRWLGVRVTIQVAFVMLILAYLGFLLVPPRPNWVWLLIANFCVSCSGFFALRAIYFALLEEAGIPRRLTGSAVGIISFVGYAPEIYMGPLTGWLIREARADGNVLAGYRWCFAFLLVLCICGMVAAFALKWFHGPRNARS
ncbi:MAG: MFS transporter [bacterium]|nr:MFS transporter [bacterium]